MIYDNNIAAGDKNMCKSNQDCQANKIKLNHLFGTLVWPAAAGNVAWSMLTLIINESSYDREFRIRIIILLLVSLYLGLFWWVMENRESSTEKSSLYWIIEGVKITAIVVFAIALQADKEWVVWPLGLVFIVNTVGFLTKTLVNDIRVRRWLTASNALGLVVLILGYCLCSEPYPIALLFAAAMALGIWVLKKCFTGKW